MEENTRDITSIRPKIILAFFLAMLGFALYYSISRLALKDISDKVVQLSQPNEKLDLLNGIFQDIIRIDQLQRQLAVINQSRSRSVLFTKSQVLNEKLSEYRSLILQDSLQVFKLDSLQTLLENKDRLHVTYLRTKSEFVNNKNFSAKIDSLSELVAGSVIDESSDKITLQKKTTTTQVVPSDTIRIERAPDTTKKPGFFQRLFSRKSDSEDKDSYDDFVLMDKIIEEEFEISVDSLSRTFQDTLAMQRIQEKMFQLKEEQIRKKQLLFEQELRYVNTGNELINYVFTILQDIEYVEMQMLERETETAVLVATKSLKWNNILLLVFIFSGSILVFLILTDITKSRVYRVKLEQEKLRVEELSKVKERFLANVSHELKTPLQTIIGYTELMEAEPTKENISVVKNSADHLNYLVSDILDYSKIMTDKFELTDRTFDFRSVLEYAYQSQLPLLHGKQIDFKLLCNFEDQEIVVRGDEFRLRQILINLLNNAIKFTKSGYIVLKADIINKEADNYSIELAVKDSGCGIAQEHQETIFEYFEQIEDKDTLIFQKGTGLGLAIVKQLILRMNASIRLESEINKGTTFFINLNLPKGDISEFAATLENPMNHLPNKPNFIPHIHVIDDEPYILDLMKNIFQKNAIEGSFFSSVDQFLDAARISEPKIVITDLRMPGKDGIQLNEIIKSMFPSNNIYMMAMTAQATPEQIKELMELGFDAVLSKPFKKMELLAAIYQGCETTASIVRAEMLEPDDDVSIDLQIDKDLDVLRKLILQNDTDRLVDLLHRLSSRVGFSGDEKLAILLRKYELDIRSNPTDERIINSLFDALKAYEAETPSA